MKRITNRRSGAVVRRLRVVLLAAALPLLAAAPAVAADGPVDDGAVPTSVALQELSGIDGPFVQIGGHISILNDSSDRALLAGAFGYGMRGGYRWSGWGVFVVVQHDLWLGLEQESEVQFGAVNVGVGAELTYARGFVRTALAIGPSILAEGTALDEAGTTGLFLDVRPVGLRFDVHDNLVLGLDPLTFGLVAPVLGGIPLIQVEYRTALYLEAAW